MKKLVVFMAVMMVLLAVAVGCSDKPENSSSTNTPSKETPSSEDTSPLSENTSPLKVKVVIPTFGVDPTDKLIQQEYEKEMDAYMGRHIEFEWNRIPWGEYGEKMKLMLTSGDIPDVMLVVEHDNIRKFGDAGLFVNLAEYMDDVPNYNTFLDATESVESYLYTPEKKIYAFYDGYTNQTDMEPNQAGAAYNLAVFEKNNIKVPTTMDELYDAAKKLKSIYPDSYPIGNSGGWGLGGFLSANHTENGIYWNGKEFVLGPTETSYKEAVEFVHRLYSEKLLDPAFWTDGIDQAKAKALSGKTFVFQGIWADYVYQLYSTKPTDTKWALSLYPDNLKYGKSWKRGSEPIGKGLDSNYGIVVSSKAKNIDQLIKLVDYQYSNKMIDLLMWGIEGTTYEVKDGKKDFLSAIKDANFNEELAKLCVSTSWSCRPGINFTPQERTAKYASYPDTLYYHDGKAVLENHWVASDKYGGKESVSPNNRSPRIIFTQDETDLISQTMTSVNTYIDESIVKFIKGEMDLADWDDFQAQIKKTGDYESILKLHNDKVVK